MQDILERFRQCGIQPTPQRLAVAQFVLFTDTHPTAEDVYAQVQPGCPTLSKATVYNTLNLLVERGLLKPQHLREDAVIFDARTEPHHHFIDDRTGRVYDIPSGALEILGQDQLADFEITGYQITLRGRMKTRKGQRSSGTSALGRKG